MTSAETNPARVLAAYEEMMGEDLSDLDHAEVLAVITDWVGHDRTTQEALDLLADECIDIRREVTR